jgi:hypothetical protein
MSKFHDDFLSVENAAHRGAFGQNDLPIPSYAQAKAGNYMVGRTTLYGLPIAIEQPRHSYRTGIGANGARWANRMAAHYGYFSGTKGADGDGVDCFIGPCLQAECAYVINQYIAGQFDEHKVMLGFLDEGMAQRAYSDSYDRNWAGLKSIIPITINQLRWWLKRGDLTRPLAAHTLPAQGIETMLKPPIWDADANITGQTLDQCLYAIRRSDEGLLLDSVCAADIYEDSDGVILLDALVIPFVKLQRKMTVVQKVMERVSVKVKPVSMTVSDPFKLRGAAQVAVIYDLSDGQTVSILFHNPDSTPSKILPSDEMISWKWMLNKKDITIVVAPERGADLNINEVARRIMKLAEKNSAAFMRANAKRSERMAAIAGVKEEVASLEAELGQLQNDLEVAKQDAEDRKMRGDSPESTPQPAEASDVVAHLGEAEEPLITASDDQVTTPEAQALPLEVPKEVIAIIEPLVVEEVPEQDEGRESIVKTAKGTKVVTGFKVVEASILIASHDIDGNENPLYPMELQPRDRSRDTSIAWVKKTAANLDPESLGRTSRADTGAPIVGPDWVVESGNGRTMAILEAYRTGQAVEYKQWLIDEADYFKISAEKISVMQQPVLVRVRKSNIDRREFAVEANQDDKLAMTATERARSDAKRLTDDLVSRMGESGDLLATENALFLAGFLQSLGDAESAQYVTSNGKPTASLVARVQAAIFSKAYNDDRLLELTADSAKPEIANVINALNSAAPSFIQAANVNQAGVEGITKQLTDSIELSLNKQAVDAVIGAINVVLEAKQKGMDVGELVGQRGLFGDTDPNIAAMAVFIAKNSRSGKRLGTAFRAMAEHIKNEGERAQTIDMFGDSVPVSLSDVIGAANKALDKEFGEGSFSIHAPDLFSTPEAIPELAQMAADTQQDVAMPLSIVLTGKELGEFPDTNEGKKALRNAAKEFVAQFRGEMVNCPALGGKVEIRQRGIKEMFAFSGDSRKLKIIPAIKALIESATLGETQPNFKKDKKPFSNAYHRLNSVATLEEKLVNVTVVVEEDSSGLLHYDFLITPDLAPTKTALDQVVSAEDVLARSPDHNSGLGNNLILDDTNLLVNQVEATGVLNLFIDNDTSVEAEIITKGVEVIKNEEMGEEGASQGEALLAIDENEAANADQLAPVSSPMMQDTGVDQADKDYLQSIADGNEDFSNPELADRLEALYLKYEQDVDMEALASLAVDAYSDHAVSFMNAALAL